MVRMMKPGTVIVDVAVDQGGCVATTVETTHEHPVVERFGVLHYGVANIPAAVPHTSTYALTNATFPYVLSLADFGLREAVTSDPALCQGIAVAGGHVTNAATAEALGRAPADPLDALDRRA
jgi:alanine dehydrogenase